MFRLTIVALTLCVAALSAPCFGDMPNGQPSMPMTNGTSINWMTNYQDAVAKAKSEKKPLVLFFTGSDWCGWCKKMESEILNTPDFASAAGSRFVFVMLDYPMNKALPQALADQNAGLK